MYGLERQTVYAYFKKHSSELINSSSRQHSILFLTHYKESTNYDENDDFDTSNSFLTCFLYVQLMVQLIVDYVTNALPDATIVTWAHEQRYFNEFGRSWKKFTFYRSVTARREGKSQPLVNIDIRFLLNFVGIEHSWCQESWLISIQLQSFRLEQLKRAI